MRGPIIVLLLIAAPAFAEERTWTVSTGTYAMAAELVEVRGDIAYLKTGDKIEHIPLARLSAGDIAYITAQSRPATFPQSEIVDAPTGVAPANVSIVPPPATLTAPVNPADTLPLMAPSNGVEHSLLRTPIQQTTPNVTASEQVAPRTTVRANYEEEMPLAPTYTQPPQTNTRVAQPAPRTLTNSNAKSNTATNANGRRPPQTQQRPPQNANANQNRSRTDDRQGGLFRRGRRP